MKKVIRKLRANQGVTILLSLLLFLVCAVTSSVLITAGTAASGTIKERTELDQRYFSVTSAAGLLRNKFDGKSVRLTVQNGAITYRELVRKNADDEPEYIPFECNDEGEIISSDDWKAEERFVVKQSLNKVNNNSPSNFPPSYIQIDCAGLNERQKEALEVKVNIGINSSNSGLIFEVESGDNGDNNESGDNGGKNFRLRMEYTASIVQEVGADVVTYQINWEMGPASVVAD